MVKIQILLVVVMFSVGVLSQQFDAQQQQQQQQPQVQPQVQSQDQPQVVREKNNNDGSGNYLFTYELSNNQIFSEAGELRTFGDQQAVVKSGAYSYVGPDGITYWVTYTADENGYHPTIGTGPGGIQGGQDAQIDPNALKSLVG